MSFGEINPYQKSSAPTVYIGMEQVSSTELVDAAKQRDCELVHKLIQNGMDVDCKNEKGETALHAAAQNGDLTMVWFLIEKGANVNAVNEDLQTPLRYAIDSQEVDVVEQLLEHGADISIKDKWHVSPSSMIFKDPEIENLVLKNEHLKKVNKTFQSSFQKYLETPESFEALSKIANELQETNLVEIARELGILKSEESFLGEERRKWTEERVKLSEQILVLKTNNEMVHTTLEELENLIGKIDIENEKGPLYPKELQERIQLLYKMNHEISYKLGELSTRALSAELVETELLEKIDIVRSKYLNDQKELQNGINTLRACNKEINKEFESITELVKSMVASMNAERDKNLESSNMLSGILTRVFLEKRN